MAELRLETILRVCVLAALSLAASDGCGCVFGFSALTTVLPSMLEMRKDTTVGGRASNGGGWTEFANSAGGRWTNGGRGQDLTQRRRLGRPREGDEAGPGRGFRNATTSGGKRRDGGCHLRVDSAMPEL